MRKRKSDDNNEDNIAYLNPVMASPDAWGNVLTDYLTHIRNTINSPLVVISSPALSRVISATNDLVSALEQRRAAMSLPPLRVAPSPALIQSKLAQLTKAMTDPQKKPCQRKARDTIVVDVLNWILDSTASDEEKLKFFPVMRLKKKSILFILCGMDNNQELFDKVIALFSKNETNPEVIKKINNAIRYLLKRIHKKGMPEKLTSCLTVVENLDRSCRRNDAAISLLEYWLTHEIKVNSNFYVDILTKILAKTSINTKIAVLVMWTGIYLKFDAHNPKKAFFWEAGTENPKSFIIHLISNLIETNVTSLFDALPNYKVDLFQINRLPPPSKQFIQKYAMDVQLPSQKFKIVLTGISEKTDSININGVTSLFIIAIHTGNRELIKILMDTDLKYYIRWDTPIVCLFLQYIGPEIEETLKIISLTFLLVHLEPSFPYLSQYLDALSRAPLINDKYISLTQFFGDKFPGSDHNKLVETEQFLETLRQQPTTLRTIQQKFTDLIKQLHGAFFQDFFPFDLTKTVIAYLFSGNAGNLFSEISSQQSKIDWVSTPILPYSSYSSVAFYSSAISSSSSQPQLGSPEFNMKF